MTVLHEKQGSEVRRNDWLRDEYPRQLKSVILRPRALGQKDSLVGGGCVRYNAQHRALRIDETMALEGVDDCSARWLNRRAFMGCYI